MKIVAVVFANFSVAPFGGPSQLRSQLGAQPVLAHTLRRLARVEGLAGRCLFVHPRDEEPARQILREAGLEEHIELLPKDTLARPRRLLHTSCRKWNLESWRGGLMGATWFDEFVDPRAAAFVVNQYGCEGVFCFDGHQAVLDPVLASAMLRHVETSEHEAKLVFSQAPPGLAGLILRREALRDILDRNVPLGLFLTYRPELAQLDPITHTICYQLPSEVVHSAGRFLADTRRSRELLESALKELGPEADARALCAWSREPGHDRAGPLPVEVELELTTADPLPNTTLRPRGKRVPRRELADLALVERLAAQLAEYDDRLVFLGGHGDPLQHPRFGEVCRILRAGGVFGIGLATPLLDLSDENVEALLANKVDVLEVQLDAHTAATYANVHRIDGFDRVVANVERLEQIRHDRRAPQPVIACSLTRCAATIEEMEDFYDGWFRKLGTALIRGYNDYGGLLAADTLLSTSPHTRGPCRRLAARLLLLADGCVPRCGQDLLCQAPLADWTTHNLRGIWAGEPLAALRRAHREQSLEALPECVRCSEWNRP